MGIIVFIVMIIGLIQIVRVFQKRHLDTYTSAPRNTDRRFSHTRDHYYDEKKTTGPIIIERITEPTETSTEKPDSVTNRRFDFDRVSNPELTGLLREGNIQLDRIDAYCREIKEPEMKHRTEAMIKVMEEIYRNLIKDPADLKHVRQILPRYSETILTILEKYSGLSHSPYRDEKLEQSYTKMLCMEEVE